MTPFVSEGNLQVSGFMFSHLLKGPYTTTTTVPTGYHQRQYNIDHSYTLILLYSYRAFGVSLLVAFRMDYIQCSD